MYDECDLVENETGTNDDSWCLTHNAGANDGDQCRVARYHSSNGWGR